MLTSLTILSESLKERSRLHHIDFKPGANVLIGPNGAGKSTILSLVSDASNGGKNSAYKNAYRITHSVGPFSVFVKDFEKDNPRIKHSIEYSKTPGLDLISRFKSHGESSMIFIDALETLSDEPSCVIMDEPEVALDAANLVKTKELIESMSSRHQFIIVTHNPILWSIKGANLICFCEEYYRNAVTSYRLSVA